jgi:hypothetical protein
MLVLGHTVVQVVRGLPPASVASVGIYGGQSCTGKGVLRVLWIPLIIVFPSAATYLSSITRGWYNKPNNNRHSKWTQSHPIQGN